MQRPHIPRLAFHSSSLGAASSAVRPPHSASQSKRTTPPLAFSVTGVNPTAHALSASHLSTVAPSPANHTLAKSLPNPPAASAYQHDRYTDDVNAQQQREEEEQQQAAEDEEEENYDEHEFEEEDKHDDDADEISRPISHPNRTAGHKSATSSSSSSQTRVPIWNGHTVFQRAEAMLEDDDDPSDEEENAVSSTVVTRRRLRDSAVRIQDSRMIEQEIGQEDGDTGSNGNSASSSARNHTSSKRSSRRTSMNTAHTTNESHAASSSALTSSSAAASVAPLRSRPERTSIRNWIATHSTQAQRIEILEREHFTWLASRKSWFTSGSEEVNMIADMERERYESSESLVKERTSFLHEIQRIKDVLKKFKSHLAAPQANESYGIQLSKIMQEIEDLLAAFKQKAKEKYMKLNASEMELTQELDAIQNGFERWTEQEKEEEIQQQQQLMTGQKKTTKVTSDEATLSADSASDPSSTADSSNTTSTSTLLTIRAALTRIDSDLLSLGGLTCGWDPRDHSHFLKLRTQMLGVMPTHTDVVPSSQFLARVSSEITNQTPETVLQHYEATLKYQRLQEEKKDLVVKWKQLKEEKRKVDEEKRKKKEEDIEKEKEEQKHIQSLLDAERASKSAAVSEWKNQKQAILDEKRERKREKEEMKKREEKERREDERRRLRSIVHAYQEDRAVAALVEEIQSTPSQQELQQQERLEREKQRKMKEQQEESILRAKEKRLAKEALTARIEEKRIAMEKAATATVGPTTQRDPSRLIQPTTAVLQRAKQRAQEEAEIVTYQKTHGGRTPSTMLARPMMGSTATPSWRQGL